MCFFIKKLKNENYSQTPMYPFEMLPQPAYNSACCEAFCLGVGHHTFDG